MNPDFYLVTSIAIIALVTLLTRAVPFLLFGKRELPPAMKYLGNVLPPAIMVILVCYCIRNVDFLHISSSYPELLACIAVALIHTWKKNMYLSIIVGTLFYMILIRL